MYKRSQSNTIGPMGKNIAYLKVCPLAEQCHSASLMGVRVEQIRELIRLREGIDRQDVLSESDLEDILHFLCIS